MVAAGSEVDELVGAGSVVVVLPPALPGRVVEVVVVTAGGVVEVVVEVGGTTTLPVASWPEGTVTVTVTVSLCTTTLSSTTGFSTTRSRMITRSMGSPVTME